MGQAYDKNMGNKLTPEKKRVTTLKKKRRSRYFSLGFSAIYLLLSIVFIVQVAIFNMLPLKYLIPAILVILLIAFGLIYVQLKRRLPKITYYLGRVIIVILGVALVIANLTIFKTNSGINQIANNKSKITISVVVKKDSKAKTIQNLKSAHFGRAQSGTQQYVVKALADVANAVGKDITPKSYTSVKDLTSALLDGKIDAVVMEENMRSLYNDANPDFTKDTKVIWQKSFVKTEDKNTKAVAVTEKPFNVYITGLDTYGTPDTIGRSDVNMIVTVNPKTHQVLLTNIPRDYYVPQTCQAGEKDKLTHSGIFGVDCTTKAVENYFGVSINYYLKVNFSGILNILTAIGDIEINNPFDFTAGEGNFHFPVGKLKLNAHQALGYARERQSFRSSDAVRIENQSRILEGVISKVTSPTILLRYASLIDALSDSFQTNMSRSDINALVRMQIDQMPNWTISQISVIGSDATKFSPANGFDADVTIPDKASVKEAVNIINMVEDGKSATTIKKAVTSFKKKNVVDQKVLNKDVYKNRTDLGERTEVQKDN